MVTWYWNGYAYSRVPGEPDRTLFAVEGMNMRQCGPLGNASDGSFKMVTREILLYKDPKTGEVLRTWDNPWTGRQVKVVHVANDPVNQRLGATDRAGRPFQLPIVVNASQWWLTSTVPLFYRNPLGGDYQDYVGGKYHAAELFNFFGDVDELANPRRPSVSAQGGLGAHVGMAAVDGDGGARRAHLLQHCRSQAGSLRRHARGHEGRDQGQLSGVCGATAARRRAAQRDQLDLLQESYPGAAMSRK